MTYINQVFESAFEFFILILESGLLGTLLRSCRLSILAGHLRLRLLPANWHLVTTH